jgi:hypothetical protein
MWDEVNLKVLVGLEELVTGLEVVDIRAVMCENNPSLDDTLSDGE